MNIGFITPEYEGYTQVRGIAAYLQALAIKLAKKHKVVIITKSTIQDLSDSIPHCQGNIKIYPIYCQRRTLFGLIEFAWHVSRILPKIIKTEKLDILEVPDTHFSTLFARNINIPLVLRLHTPLSMISRGNLFNIHRWVLHALEKFNCKKYSAVSSPSQASLYRISQYLQLSPKLKSVVIPNGISPSIQYQKSHQQAQQEIYKLYPQLKDKPIALFIGNQSKNKGFSTLLCAAHNLPNVNFVCTGLRALKHMNLPSNFWNVGYQQGINKERWLKAADMLLVLSLWETFPTVVLEGMKYKIPIITSKVGGIPEMVNNTMAYLIPPNNPKDLIEAINYLLDNPLNNTTKVNQAYQKFIQQYTSDKTSKQTEKFYESFIKTR